jgi:HPt (histidine-containing phosphotransfer) domain-containing protein
METEPVIFDVETALAACRGDPALARALAEQYRASLPEEQTALAQARAAMPPDWETVRKRVHRLQSGGAFLGAERIAVAAQRLEANILTHAAPTALEAVYRALECAFDEFLAIPVEEWERRLRVVHRPSASAV